MLMDKWRFTMQLLRNRKVGKKASAYYCFCGNHDTEIFKPIENDNPFDPLNKEQLFVHTLRSFAYEYHHKRIELDSKLPVDQLSDLFSSFFKIIGKDHTSKDNVKDELKSRYDEHMYAHERVKKELIRAYKEKDYDSLTYKTFVIDEKFVFASAGTLMADIISPYEVNIFNHDKSESLLPRPAIILTVFPDPSKNSTNIILACLNIDKNALLYLNKYNSMATQDILLAISSLMLTTNQKNTFFHPTYWEALEKHPRKEFLYKEIQKNRGFDLLAKNVQLSEFNLFDENLIWSKIETNT